LISGTIGDHGVAILSAREGLEFSTALVSDCAPLNPLVEKLVATSPHIHCLRIPPVEGCPARSMSLPVNRESEFGSRKTGFR